ncbi:hypothetical protein [Pontibacillus marinus]|uniref:Uncharacterized protein n=1 Tax=Pontibacillus marinus BH030004 = DSM 16465 TaxID=1385511 RepID=A0A0A5FZ51_9BACI|nr:hypothetical protein [Pontibacillus marinus]KGX84090.1 hypothetical protein N783_19140 [Pontibacillus marinus BH030004 = DSM 16465]
MEAYCINTTNSLVRNQWKPLQLAVRDGKWCETSTLEHQTKNLVIDPFWIGPGKIYIDLEFPLYDAPYRTALLRRYIYRGCTMIITQLPIRSKKQMKVMWEQYKQDLELMAIDYMVAPRISLHRIDSEVVRYFGRQKAPFIIAEVTDENSLNITKWEWLGQAQGSSFIPIVPVFPNPATEKNLKKTWDQIMTAYSIRTLPDPLNELPLSVGNLYAAGISPFKGDIRTLGDADYNLYINDERQIEAPDQMFYHRAIPYVTVLRGKVIRAHVEMNDEKGYGRLTDISIPNHFTHR